MTNQPEMTSAAAIKRLAKMYTSPFYNEELVAEMFTLAIQGSIREAMEERDSRITAQVAEYGHAYDMDGNRVSVCHCPERSTPHAAHPPSPSPEAVVLGKLRRWIDSVPPECVGRGTVMDFIDRELEAARRG